MNSKERNLNILSHIVKYCDEIAETHEHFAKSYDVFKTNSIYRNAIACAFYKLVNWQAIFLMTSRQPIQEFNGKASKV